MDEACIQYRLYAFYPTPTLTYHTQVLLLAILLLIWSDNVPIQTDDTLVAMSSGYWVRPARQLLWDASFITQALEWLEYFAGAAQVTRHVKACGYRGCKFDIQYCTSYKQHNYMDLLTPSGMAPLSSIMIRASNPRNHDVRSLTSAALAA